MENTTRGGQEEENEGGEGEGEGEGERKGERTVGRRLEGIHPLNPPAPVPGRGRKPPPAGKAIGFV